MKNWVKAYLLAFLLSFGHFAYAGVVINEIMYDLDGGDIDWVEVYNPDSADVDLTTLKLLISNSTSNHSINSSSGGAVLRSGEYGVIVGSSMISNYTAKWGSVGKIFTSSYSLPNTGGKVEINNGDKLNPISTLTYESSHGAAGNGKSLQKISGTWQESLPTSGKENILSSSSGNDDHTTGGNTDTNTDGTADGASGSGSAGGFSSSSTKIESAKITTKITAKSNAIFAGLYTAFKAETVGTDGLPLFYGRYFLNFGDGSSKEMKVREGETVNHIYSYSGEYTVTLEYYINDYGDIPDATDSLLIDVLSVDILISKVGNEKDFFIEISNNTDNDVDISKWMLISGEKRFIFPKNTFILSKNKIIFSPWVTGLIYADRNDLKLVDQNWKTIFDYGLSITPAVVNPALEVKRTTAKSVVKSIALSDDLELVSGSTQASFTNLEAGVVRSDILQEENTNIYVILFGLLLVVSGVGIYFIRRRKSVSTLDGSEDFEILDE